MKNTQKAGIVGATLIAAAAFITPWEGVATHAYHDQFANGLPTICIGATEGVKMGDVKTPAQCRQMLAESLPRYDQAMMACVHVPISDKEHIAYLSGSYNYGPGAFCKSSMARKLNAGDHVGACNAILLYNRTKSAGVVKGLTRRRQAENKLCLEGLQKPPVSKWAAFLSYVKGS